MACTLCGGAGRLADSPCGCDAGASGRAVMRADRARREAERRIEKARGAKHAASEFATRAALRALGREWNAGRKMRIARGSGIRELLEAQSALARAARRAALIERDVRGSPAGAAWRARYGREVALVLARARAARGPEPLRAVLARVVAELGPAVTLTCTECGRANAPASGICADCAARDLSTPSSTRPDGPAPVEAAPGHPSPSGARAASPSP